MMPASVPFRFRGFATSVPNKCRLALFVDRIGVPTHVAL